MKKKAALIIAIIILVLVAAGVTVWLLRGDTPSAPESGTTTAQADDGTTAAQTPAEMVEHVVIADSFKVPQLSEVNIFSYIQTVQAMNLKKQVEECFGIAELVSTENTADLFFDSRGTDKNGSSVTFQQNINSGSFVYSTDFSFENNKAFAAANKNTSLESVRAQLESKAKELAKTFESVTGELVLKKSEKVEMSVPLSSDIEDYYSYQTYNFVFLLKSPVTVPAADGVECSETYNDSFTVMLRPDGEVISIFSNLTNAPMENTGTEKMFTLEQFRQYETANIEAMYEGEGSESVDPNLQYVYTACRLVYSNDHGAGNYVPGVVITYHSADAPDEELEEYCPIRFVRDGI